VARLKVKARENRCFSQAVMIPPAKINFRMRILERTASENQFFANTSLRGPPAKIFLGAKKTKIQIQIDSNMPLNYKYKSTITNSSIDSNTSPQSQSITMQFHNHK
jgi:hypothetical protein